MNNIDQFIQLDAQIKELSKRRDALKKEVLEIMDATKQDFVFGQSNTVGLRKVEAIRSTLDTKAVKVEMGEAWFDERTKCSLVTSLRISNSSNEVA
tara:strand:- start:70 stop:357 length:288 start_codon:yes stop_codon:yes gene_type:complete